MLALPRGWWAGIGWLVCVGAQAAGPQAGDIDVVWSHEAAVGAFGEAATRTHVAQTTLTLRYHGQAAGRPWSAEVQLPHLRVRTNATRGGLPDGLQGGGSREQGRGDVWWIGRISLREAEIGRAGLDLALKLKTAEGAAAQGLGSGARDLALQLEWQQPVAAGQFFGLLGWRHTGDLPGQRPYRNPWYGQMGWQSMPMADVEWGWSVDAREPIGRLGALLETSAFGAVRQGPHRVLLYVTKGWRPASPDWALGLAWRQRF